MNIRRAETKDIDDIAKIYAACFPNELNSKLWIETSFKAYPRNVYYVIESEGIVAGYILWCVKNGFRESTIAELEQIGVHPDASGKGLGRRLIETSFNLFKTHVNDLGHTIGSVIVTTTEGNYAENLYKSTLGVSRAALITGYGSGNEIILYNNRVD